MILSLYTKRCSRWQRSLQCFFLSVLFWLWNGRNLDTWLLPKLADRHSGLRNPRARTFCSTSDHIEMQMHLCSIIRKGVTEDQLNFLEQIVEKVQESGQSHLVGTDRSFGYGGGSQKVTYLHLHLPSASRTILSNLVSHAAKEMKWNTNDPKLQLRCLEAITYRGSNFPSQDALGWHNDGTTLYTTSIALGSAGLDYQGGALEIKVPGGHREAVSDLQRGDVAVFRGWDNHRVKPVQGIRRVIVAEWWLGEECNETVLRPGESELNSLKVLSQPAPHGTECAEAHLILGRLLFSKPGRELDAKLHFQAALRIDPSSLVPVGFGDTIQVEEAVSGLCEWLSSRGLSRHFDMVNQWCENMGATDLFEVVESTNEIADCLGQELTDEERSMLVRGTR